MGTCLAGCLSFINAGCFNILKTGKILMLRGCAGFLLLVFCFWRKPGGKCKPCCLFFLFSVCMQERMHEPPTMAKHNCACAVGCDRRTDTVKIMLSSTLGSIVNYTSTTPFLRASSHKYLPYTTKATTTVTGNKANTHQ